MIPMVRANTRPMRASSLGMRLLRTAPIRWRSLNPYAALPTYSSCEGALENDKVSALAQPHGAVRRVAYLVGGDPLLPRWKWTNPLALGGRPAAGIARSQIGWGSTVRRWVRAHAFAG